MTQEDRNAETEKAVAFLHSLRGNWIVGQALTVAARALAGPASTRPYHEQEPSNAKDMLYLRDSLFSMYSDVQASLTTAAVTAERHIEQDKAGDKQDEADNRRESEGEGR